MNKERYEELQKKSLNGQTTKEERIELVELARQELAEDREKLGADKIDRLTAILYQKDVVVLVNCGVPEDEYEYEARLILREATGLTDRNEVAAVVRRVFTRQFGGPKNEIDSELPVYGEIADEVLAL